MTAGSRWDRRTSRDGCIGRDKSHSCAGAVLRTGAAEDFRKEFLMRVDGMFRQKTSARRVPRADEQEVRKKRGRIYVCGLSGNGD